MVKVRWLTRTASANGVIQPGEIREWDSREAHALAKAGYVEILEEEEKKQPVRKTAAAKEE